jgi:hypothetical protein
MHANRATSWVSDPTTPVTLICAVWDNTHGRNLVTSILDATATKCVDRRGEPWSAPEQDALHFVIEARSRDAS